MQFHIGFYVNIKGVIWVVKVKVWVKGLHSLYIKQHPFSLDPLNKHLRFVENKTDMHEPVIFR